MKAFFIIYIAIFFGKKELNNILDSYAGCADCLSDRWNVFCFWSILFLTGLVFVNITKLNPVFNEFDL